MTSIQAMIFPDAEEFLRVNIADIMSGVDRVSSVYGSKIKRDINLKVISVTTEDCDTDADVPAKRTHDMPALVKALATLAEFVDNGARDKTSGKDEFKDRRFYGSGWSSAIDMADPCNWDVEAYDAFFQILHYGKIIYG